MLWSKISLLPPFALLALGKESYAPLTSARVYQRQLMTCNQTYGQDSVICGGADSTFCYSPAAGQTCCSDKGFCDKGSFCAPVAGFCCIEGEDLATCARNAGFTLPTTLDNAPGSATTPVAGPTGIGMSVSLQAASTPVLSSSPTTQSGSGSRIQSSSDTSAGPAPTQISNGTIPPFVQVAMAAKAYYMTLGSATVAGVTLVLAVLW